MGSNLGHGCFQDGTSLRSAKASEGSAGRNIGFAQAGSSSQVWDAIAHVSFYHCLLRYLNHRKIANTLETQDILASRG